MTAGVIAPVMALSKVSQNHFDNYRLFDITSEANFLPSTLQNFGSSRK